MPLLTGEPVDWVQQYDDATGLPLYCIAHEDKTWCSCRSQVVAEGRDAGLLWHSLLIRGDKTTLIDVVITKNTVLMVRLLILDQWPSDRNQAQMQVQLAPKGAIAQTEPFKSDTSLLYLGFLNMGEGRGVLRQLILGRFASIFAEQMVQNGECKSRSHGLAERRLYDEVHKSSARGWDWDFNTWLGGGYCPPCYKRREEAIEKAKKASDFDRSRF